MNDLMVPVVAGVVIEQSGRFLLVQERQAIAYGLWNLPAGRVESGATLEETAIREAKEETGFDVELVRKIGIFQATAAEPPKHSFSARIVGGSLMFPEEEILDARWFSLEEIEAMSGQLRGEWVLGSIKLSIEK